MGSIGFYVMTALLGAGAAYGLTHRGQPGPGVSSGQKKILIACAAVVTVCVLLLIAVMLVSHGSRPH